MNSLHQLVLEDILAILKNIIDKIESDPQKYLTEVNHNGKSALLIDIAAEKSFKNRLEIHTPDILVYGEESHNTELNFSKHNKICALVDMVDGTDLLERGLSNWCSSVVLFHPQNPIGEKIIGAYIGTSEKEVYFGTSESNKVFVVDTLFNEREVAGCSTVSSIQNSSICFYGQKAKRLCDTVNSSLFRVLASNSSFRKTRIYNLAGMPMMVKLIDKRVKNINGIDVVFEKNGQKPHDFIPGAFLLKKAGAFLLNRDTGVEMTDVEIEEKLMMPFVEDSKSRYVAASTKELAMEIHELLD